MSLPEMIENSKRKSEKTKQMISLLQEKINQEENEKYYVDQQIEYLELSYVREENHEIEEKEYNRRSENARQIISSLQKKVKQKKEKKNDLDQHIKYLELLHNKEKQQELEEEKEYLDFYEERDKRDREQEDQDLERHMEQEREYCRMKKINPEPEYHWDIERKFRIEY
jgi:hypothetical protein